MSREESYENIVESILSLAGVGYRRLLLFVHYQRLGRGLAAMAAARTGTASPKETGLLKEWPKDGPPLAWKIKGLGGGYSAPSIAAGRIFGMSNRGDDEVVWALSETDGKELWVTRLGAGFHSRDARREKRGRDARRRSMVNGSMSWAWAATWLACRSRTARSSGNTA